MKAFDNGKLVAIMSADAERNIIPLLLAHVDSESSNDWTWILLQFKKAYKDTMFTFKSKKPLLCQRGLPELAVSVYRYMCGARLTCRAFIVYATAYQRMCIDAALTFMARTRTRNHLLLFCPVQLRSQPSQFSLTWDKASGLLLVYWVKSSLFIFATVSAIVR
jgi:hypothetical protein